MKVTYENRYWDQFNITKKDALYVLCAEIWDDRLGKPELQDQYGFGLTHLGGLTVGLPQNKLKEIVRFNYQIEESGQVGLCRPLSLLITPRDFVHRIYTNTFDKKTEKYLSDIIEANEKYVQSKEIYFTFYFVWNINENYWKTVEMKERCLKNLETKLKSMKYLYTETINIDAESISLF